MFRDSNDDEMLRRLLSVLGEAAESAGPGCEPNAEPLHRQWLIDHLESLGYLEARYGSAARGEDERELFITGITGLGRHLLELLRERLRV